MKISSKGFLIFMNMMGSLIIFSSLSWFSIWVGMELSSMTMPPLMMMMNSSLISKINSWKYFMVQCYSSAIFFMCILSLSFSSSFSSYSNLLWILIILSMLFKMGILPFHGWFFHLAFSLPWTLFLIISTIQKVGPLLIVSECSKMISQFFQPDLLIGSVISLMSIMGLKINSVRYFMVTSSIINSSWILVSAQMGKLPFLSYMFMYFMHLLILFSLLKSEFSNTLESMFFLQKKLFSAELAKIIIVLSMIGMPPMVGFFMKMSIIEQLIMFNQTASIIILTMSSSIVMLMYLKMIMSMITTMSAEKWKQFKFNLSSSSSILFSILGVLYFMI